MDLIFCHGLETGPHGRKYHALKDAGLPVEAPDFQGMALAQRVEKLIPILQAADSPVIVGSSYGGITALCATMTVVEAGGAVTGLVLCAPALARDEPPADKLELTAPVPTVIIHGTNDEVIPVQVSRDFAASHPAHVRLIEVDDDHSLAASIDRIIETTKQMMGVSE